MEIQISGKWMARGGASTLVPAEGRKGRLTSLEPLARLDSHSTERSQADFVPRLPECVGREDAKDRDFYRSYQSKRRPYLQKNLQTKIDVLPFVIGSLVYVHPVPTGGGFGLLPEDAEKVI